MSDNRDRVECPTCKKPYTPVACRECIKDVYSEGLETGKKIGDSTAAVDAVREIYDMFKWNITWKVDIKPEKFIDKIKHRYPEVVEDE